MSKIYDPTAHTAAEWTAMAQDSRRRSAESFDRCDTDGFLSQWAQDSMARMYDSLAKLAEDGGTAEFVVLADAEGNEIDGARQVESKFGGWSWVYTNAEGRTVWFNESNHSNPAVAQKRNLAKGHQMITVRKPAVAMFGKGMMAGVVWEPKRG